MFGDDYVRKIGHATENEAKAALFHILYRRYARDKGLAEDALDDDTAKLAAAVTNKVFGESGTEQTDPRFAAEKAELIEHDAHLFALDDEMCACLSGAAYNTCYARYVDAGGSRGMFSNTFLAYVRALSQGDATLTARYAERMERLGNTILAPILSMVSLKIFRPLPYGPNERAFYDATHQFCLAAKTGKRFRAVESLQAGIPDLRREESKHSKYWGEPLPQVPPDLDYFPGKGDMDVIPWAYRIHRDPRSSNRVDWVVRTEGERIARDHYVGRYDVPTPQLTKEQIEAVYEDKRP